MSEQTEVVLPTADDLVPPAGVKAWAFGARTLLKGFHDKMTIVNKEKPHVELLMTKLSRLESAIIAGTAETAARTTFVEWVRDEDEGGWPYYVKVKAADDLRLAREAREARRQEVAGWARSEAVKERNRYGSGNNNAVGMVISGLADTVSETVYVGTSGAYAYAVVQHPVMKKLLTGVVQAESWPVTGCAEVDAMNKFLIARAVTPATKIEPGTLYFHAETWNEKGGKWQARGACKNCEQWLSKIEARHG
ncbi:hypothetical protein [Streptosporangium sp. NPDC002524]|uniref:hypothetical protein n=1 Tax=Streptosporangium sp. NPDC002524 TaxID=3154537 RepID=UPI00331BC406